MSQESESYKPPGCPFLISCHSLTGLQDLSYLKEEVLVTQLSLTLSPHGL